MQCYQFFPIDRYAECILVFLRWLVRTLGLKGSGAGGLACPTIGTNIGLVNI